MTPTTSIRLAPIVPREATHALAVGIGDRLAANHRRDGGPMVGDPVLRCRWRGMEAMGYRDPPRA